MISKKGIRDRGAGIRGQAVAVWVCLCSVLSLITWADSPRTRSELLNELSLRKAQVALDLAVETHDRYKNEHDDSLRLFDQSIISNKEMDSAVSRYTQARQQLEQARITLEETQLGFLDNATHITILEAKKYYDPNGRRMLDLVLKNTSSLNQAESALVGADPNGTLGHQWQNPESIRALLDIENIIVSIVDQGSSIGKPYEQIISLLPFDEQQKLTFVLLTDVDQVGIRKQFLAKDDIETIYLEKDSLQTLPTLVASQSSLEGALGSDIAYALTLEMLVTSDHSFSMAFTNLPPQINGAFVEGGARITSVRFSEDVSKHAVSFRASIPQKLDVTKIDQKIDFQVWVATTAQLEVVNKLKRQCAPSPIPDHELDKIEAARVDLTLTPKGTGRLEILINNLYMEIKPHQPVDLKADLHNNGTLTLFNVIPEVSPPLGWTAQVTPNNIEKLLPNEEYNIQIYLQPGPDVGLGEYETQIETRGQSGSDVIEAIEKRIKIRINAETNLMVTLLLVGGLVLLIVGIVVFGVRLSRR